MSLAGLLALSACTPAVHPHVPNEAELAARPALEHDWKSRLLSNDPAIRVAAGDTLVLEGSRSIPLLRQMLRTRDETLHGEAFGVVHRIGPDAIGLLAELLGDRRASIRRDAVDILVDLAPETESIQQTLWRALKDDDVFVARDAARALGALGERAAPSRSALIEALSHRDPRVRQYAAEALASIGSSAAPATTALTTALADRDPGVRRGACEALAGIGPPAADAVPALVSALNDDDLYVRICAANALARVAPNDPTALTALKAAAVKDPVFRAETQEKTNGITATNTPQPSRASGNPPTEWDPNTGRNIAWSVELGNQTLGRPVVSGGIVYVGTDNARKRDPNFTEECGVLMAFDARDGSFLWQDLAPRVNRGLGEFLLPSTTSAPYVEGSRLYYVTAECQLRCLDARAGSVVWELDMCARLGVFPHEACNSEVLPVGDLLIVCTSNGRNEGHTRVPSPRAPSLIAVDKHSGNVVWSAIGAGADVLHGQWCSPVAANVDGRTQVLFGGGDGWMRAYDAASGREIWRFDANPRDARWRPRPGVFSRNPIVASPVCDGDGRVFIALGDDPSHGNGPSLLHAVSQNGEGDVTLTACFWTSREIGRVVGTPVLSDGLLYVGDLGGAISCIDAMTGQVVWKHETSTPIWGCLTLAGNKLYVGNEDGVMTVLRAGRQKEVLSEIEMDAPLYSAPSAVGDSLYVATARRLYFITTKP